MNSRDTGLGLKIILVRSVVTWFSVQRRLLLLSSYLRECLWLCYSHLLRTPFSRLCLKTYFTLANVYNVVVDFFRPFSFKALDIMLILVLALIVASIFVEVASQSAFRNMLNVFSYFCRRYFLPFCNNELMFLYFCLYRLLIRFLEMLQIGIKYSR